jgi:hypothetical protein
VYRRLWGWPMRSPRHLIATIVVIGAVVITIGLFVPKLTGTSTPQGAATNTGSTSSAARGTPGSQGSGGAAGPTEGQQTTSAPPSDLPTRQTAPAQTPTSAPPAPKALEIATLWAKAWVTHPQGITSEQWLNSLRPYSEEELITVMSTVDPANIPATEVTGPATAIVSYTTSVEASLPTNGGTLSITVISTPQGWKVAHYEKAA